MDIDYLLGVDGGGSGTRVRLALPDGEELALGHAGPSGLAHGIDAAWHAIDAAITLAFAASGRPRPANAALALGVGIAGASNAPWADAFRAQQPGFGALVVDSDAYTTALGAFAGQPGAIVAIGTGSVALALLPDGGRRLVGGWGFPAGDEGGGAWIGLRAAAHAERVLDGRCIASAFSDAVIAACGGADAVQRWVAAANQTAYARLAPLVLAHAPRDRDAHAIVERAAHHLALIITAVDPSGLMPLSLCGGLAQPLRHYLPRVLRARDGAPIGDAAQGALRLVAQTLEVA